MGDLPQEAAVQVRCAGLSVGYRIPLQHIGQITHDNKVRHTIGAVWALAMVVIKLGDNNILHWQD